MGETTIQICPRCNTPIVRAIYSGDYIHKCQGQDVLKKESIVKIGDYVDDDGNTVKIPNPNLQGIPNKLQGTRAGIEGAKEETRDSRGFPKSRYRERQHEEVISEDKFKKMTLSSSDPEEYNG